MQLTAPPVRAAIYVNWVVGWTLARPVLGLNSAKHDCECYADTRQPILVKAAHETETTVLSETWSNQYPMDCKQVAVELNSYQQHAQHEWNCRGCTWTILEGSRSALRHL